MIRYQIRRLTTPRPSRYVALVSEIDSQRNCVMGTWLYSIADIRRLFETTRPLGRNGKDKVAAWQAWMRRMEGYRDPNNIDDWFTEDGYPRP